MFRNGIFMMNHVFDSHEKLLIHPLVISLSSLVNDTCIHLWFLPLSNTHTLASSEQGNIKRRDYHRLTTALKDPHNSVVAK